MSTTTPSAPSSRACAAPTPTPRSTGWPRCSPRAKTRASSCAACSSWPAKISAWPTPRRWSSSRQPEGHYFLAHACLYLATAPKSNSTGAIWKALDHIQQHGPGEVPPYLRDKTDRFYGDTRDHYRQTLQEVDGERGEYRYPHDYPGGWVAQHYLPLDMEPPGWYRPKDIGYERTVRQRLAELGLLKDETP